ncbi:MAG TPA: hypothetical protein VJP45_04725, partial [Candidatus Limnocylindria bacterium]|nr:hypothetical protein [Candidatus Limnocylindria bacterium]
MIGGAAFVTIQRSLAVLVAAAVQLVAVGVVGDAFATPSRDVAAVPRSIEPAARAAPFARGDRVMTFDLIVDLALDSRLGTAAEVPVGREMVAPAAA